MKAGRRQELRSNELADALVQLKEFYEAQATYVWGGLFAIALVLVGSSLWYRTSVGRRENEWNQFYQLLGEAQTQIANTEPNTEAAVPALGALETLAQNAGDSAVRNWANLTVADIEWFRANSSEISGGDLKTAQSAFERIVDSSSSNPVMKVIAQMGLAAIDEDQGRFDDAKKHYQTVVDDMGARHTGIVPLAEQALKRLERQQVTAVFPPAPEKPADAEDTANAAETKTPPAAGASNPNIVTIKQAPMGNSGDAARFTDQVGETPPTPAPAPEKATPPANDQDAPTFTSQSSNVPTTQPAGESPE